MTLGLSLGLPRRQARASDIETPPEALPGIGDTQIQGGQKFMSTLPNNPFPPESYGWESYGEEP